MKPRAIGRMCLQWGLRPNSQLFSLYHVRTTTLRTLASIHASANPTTCHVTARSLIGWQEVGDESALLGFYPLIGKGYPHRLISQTSTRHNFLKNQSYIKFLNGNELYTPPKHRKPYSYCLKQILT